MSGDSSERKTEPASSRKLRKQREKGTVPQAAEMSNYIAQALVLLYVLGSAVWVLWQMKQNLEAGLFAITQPFEKALAETVTESIHVYAVLAAPTLFLALAAGVLVTMVYQKWMVFAVDPIIPKAEKINPAAGLKRIFGLRGWVELGLAIVRLAIWGGAFAFIVMLNYDRILSTGLCGLPCIVEVSFSTLFTLFAVAIILFFLFALIEAIMQTFLFANDQRMTKTEVKQERKDQFGSKEVRKARKKFAKELENAAEGVGRERATMAIFFGDQTVAIRYHPTDAPVPTLSAKATNQEASRELRNFIVKLGYRETESEAVVLGLIGMRPGDAVPVGLHEALKKAILTMYSGPTQ